jgi:hypothetical protein
MGATEKKGCCAAPPDEGGREGGGGEPPGDFGQRGWRTAQQEKLDEDSEGFRQSKFRRRANFLAVLQGQEFGLAGHGGFQGIYTDQYAL